ncbi:hypothetical protein CPB84DRAFT_1850724 [Gymnopilus junonius]|uniref:Uncharacterized protein n=1 Tax=Gymnopilus junonius TaxID=109634 RepID=A0A9P5NGZ5_GYMJU|nr:hypothetical protein CPB84DRAFT_1854959 [Gymnopilus junonius]KAF8884294.1 hypothetical protein CPB84DRAFT_1850724 [Gymnopilus junonius]
MEPTGMPNYIYSDEILSKWAGLFTVSTHATFDFKSLLKMGVHSSRTPSPASMPPPPPIVHTTYTPYGR